MWDVWSRWQPLGGLLPEEGGGGEGDPWGGGGRWRLASGSVARCFLLPGPTPPRLVFLHGRETTGAHKAPDSPARPQGDWLPGPLHTDCRGRAGGAQSGPISQPVPVKTEGGDREAKPFIKL